MNHYVDPIIIAREHPGELPYREFETHAGLSAYFAHAARKKDAPKLSVAVLSHKSLETLKTCVECVLRFAQGLDYELVLMDNASCDEDATYDYMQAVPHNRKKVIKALDDMGPYFNAARGWGTLWQHCEGDYILHLNDDHYVTENAIQNMMRALDEDQSIGMVNPVSSNAWMLQDPQLRFSNRDEMFEAAKRFNAYNPRAWQERVYVAAVAWMFRRELLGAMLCANPFGPELCYDFAMRAAGYRVMLLGDTWVHHDHDYGKKNSYGFTGSGPEKLLQQEYIAKATGHLTYGLKLFEDICVFEKQLAAMISPPKTEKPRLLAVDTRAGQGLLDLKNQLRAYGAFEPACAAFSTQAKYYPTLYTMAEEVVIGKIGELAESFPQKSFDYIIAGEPLNRYPDWGNAHAALSAMLKPGGELLYKLLGPANEAVLYNARRGEA